MTTLKPEREIVIVRLPYEPPTDREPRVIDPRRNGGGRITVVYLEDYEGSSDNE